MNEKEFLDWCKIEVVKYTNDHLDKSDNKQITVDDVFMVWCCKTLQNNKHLSSWLTFHRRGMTKWSPNSNAWNP